MEPLLVCDRMRRLADLLPYVCLSVQCHVVDAADHGFHSLVYLHHYMGVQALLWKRLSFVCFLDEPHRDE
jgi:hypothetical protein